MNLKNKNRDIDIYLVNLRSIYDSTCNMSQQSPPITPNVPQMPSTPVKNSSTQGSCIFGKHLPYVAGFFTFVLCLSLLLVYMEHRAMKHEQFIVNMSQDYDFLGVEQDNLQFINFIRNYHLRDAVDQHSKAVEFTATQPNQIVAYVLKLLNNKKNGVFIEAGAYSEVNTSETEWLEKKLGWKGLLIQPDIRHYFDLRKHNRSQSKSVHGCLSPTPYLREVNYCQDDEPDGVKIHSTIHSNALLEDSGRCTRVKCFPLYSLLLAMDLTTVHYLSLATRGGSELQVLETIPYDRVVITVIGVRMEEDKDRVTVREFLASKRYGLVHTVNGTDLFMLSPFKI